MYTPIPMKRSTRYGNNYWEAFSVKMNRDVRFFSDLEYDHWILVEADSDIVAFCEQPKRIQVEWQGELVESIFDMWIQRMNGTECFLEVKYASELDPNDKRFSSRSYKQTNAQAKWCQENGYNHLIRTDKDIRSNLIYLNNLKTIIPYIQQRPVLVETVQYQIMNVLGKTSKTTIEGIEQALPVLGRQRIRETVYQLIYRGMIDSTITHKPLDSKTEVWSNA
ncbi:TnsA endonuclease N terminal [Paenibacillus algorifonticola]|uniref:TnsA endonuclease N terminal n=1 Tax=Paenibacillus algorifonticola TaxID=684063 RepID=A0A1I1Z1T5_9BACL|nr:TnsA endonuclease N-terminal domain-containing protein [Paenibacillus algorifonticola]SFE24393.1 TnsA endonuclease N terminal [Paenibacillus algorifonticola]